MTSGGYLRLEEELKRLKNDERPAVIKALADAREHGDLSENAEYHAARERQSFIEGRMIEIEDKAQEDNLPLFTLETEKLVGEAMEPLRRLARIADATAAEVKRARKAMDDAREAVRPAEALCDITTASRLAQERLPIDLERWDSLRESIAASKPLLTAQKRLTGWPRAVAGPGLPQTRTCSH